MRNLSHPFWISFTIILSLIFIIIFPVSIIGQNGIINKSVFTFTGVAVIWIVIAFVHIFFQPFSLKNMGLKKIQTENKNIQDF